VLGWLVNGGQNWEMEDAREGGGVKPDRGTSLTLQEQRGFFAHVQQPNNPTICEL
jgi:hypothetical protein